MRNALLFSLLVLLSLVNIFYFHKTIAGEVIDRALIQEASYPHQVLKTHARRCNIPAPVSSDAFRSQQGEDKFLLKNYFKNVCDCEGTYIEMGALDGISFSNSWVFNKVMNWKGLLIEADLRIEKMNLLK